MTGQSKDEKGGRGFDGLGDLLADNDKNAGGREHAPAGHRGPSSGDRALPPDGPLPLPRSSNTPRALDINSAARRVQAPQRKPVPWGWIGAAVALVVIVIANIADQPGSYSGNHAADSRQTEPAAQADSPKASFLVSDSERLRPPPVDDLVETLPPVGRDWVLSRDQIRYCVAENIRLDAMGRAVNEYESAEVDTFNNYVNNYNSRCGSYKYRSGDLESVERQISAVRDRLELEGRSRLRGP